MNYKMIRNLAGILFLVLGGQPLRAGDFYTVQKVEYLKKPTNRGPVVFKEVEKLDKDGNKIGKPEKVFVPCLRVRLLTKEQTKASTTFAKVYFYDSEYKLIDKIEKPSLADNGNVKAYATPIFYPKSDSVSIVFALPDKILKHTGEWTAIVIFGDQNGAGAATFPEGGIIERYEFPERKFYEAKHQIVDRKAAMDPVIEHVVKTGNSKQPQITLFLRPPIGMTDASQAKGVLALCLLANRVEDLRRQLQAIDSGDEIEGILKFAEKHQLLILCWGSRSLWNPGKNWDEQSKEVNKELDETFDEVAEAWSRGVEQLARKYGMPKQDFLIRGSSGAAQYAARLALRKPQYFLAVHAHIPSSFDVPTREANRVLWCLTTGEKESGYERSLRFYERCKELGYPMVYKAIVGLGHAGHPNTQNLGLKFFEYALSVRDQRHAYNAKLKEMARSSNLLEKEEEQGLPWLESFRVPPYVGDAVNQEMFPLSQIEMVPPGFRVPLPTKEIAEAWNRK